MNENTVGRVAAEAYLDDRDEALERARRATGNDPDWDEFEQEVIAGALIPLRLRVSVQASAGGEGFTIERENEDVWAAAPDHLPELADEVRATAPKDFGSLASELRERGVEVSSDQLGGMYVEVTLDEALREAVSHTSERATY